MPKKKKKKFCKARLWLEVEVPEVSKDVRAATPAGVDDKWRGSIRAKKFPPHPFFVLDSYQLSPSFLPHSIPVELKNYVNSIHSVRLAAYKCQFSP